MLFFLQSELKKPPTCRAEERLALTDREPTCTPCECADGVASSDEKLNTVLVAVFGLTLLVGAFAGFALGRQHGDGVHLAGHAGR